MKVFKIDIGYLFVLILCLEELIRSVVIKSTFDIHLHDTLFVIAKSLWWQVLTLYFVLMLFANHYLAKKMSVRNVFSWIVLIITLLLAITVNSLIQIADGIRHSSLTPDSFTRIDNMDSIVAMAMLIIAITQIAFWLYFLTQFIRKSFFNKGPS